MYDSCLQQNQNWLKRQQSEKSNTQGKWDRISQTGGSQNTHTHKHEPGSASKQANAMLLGGAQCGDNAETWTQRCTNTNSYSTNTTCVTAGTIPYKKSSQNVLQKQDHTLKGIKTNKSQCKGVCKSSCTTWKIVKDHVVKGWNRPPPPQLHKASGKLQLGTDHTTLPQRRGVFCSASTQEGAWQE